MWKKLALFFSYYGADYEPEELKEAYSLQVRKLTETFRKEQQKKAEKENDGQPDKKNRNSGEGTESPEYESSPEIQMEEVFLQLYRERGVEADRTLAVHTRTVFPKPFHRISPAVRRSGSHAFQPEKGWEKRFICCPTPRVYLRRTKSKRFIWTGGLTACFCRRITGAKSRIRVFLKRF